MIDPHVVVNAHRFLYYVLKCPCWADSQYDGYLKAHKIGGLDKPSADIYDYTPLEIQRALSTLNFHVMKNYVSMEAQKHIDWNVMKEAKEIVALFFHLNTSKES